ncbi:hypothetical protein HJC10_36090 [Corallococcus exiguus]|uniref:hypothetical protein n=1 Tax=Corallococcus exiguus TaxID=83462 RepID=UPI001471DEB6|nr:hypothetical protein [Corallococcus exiguus]NNB89234.1 hypothetical protein [Corallococcus exiguus]NNC08247.1 hypothetical protein [Corallococcus exiguus]
MPLLCNVRALTGTAVLCVLSLLLVQCASDDPEDACDAGCLAGETCQDAGCIDEACVGVVCPGGQVCAGGDCVQPAVIIPTPVEAQWGTKQENGEACAANRDCNSGSCADGVCCDSACDGKCDACNLPGNEGTCTVAPRGTACDDGDACTVEDVCDGEGENACSGTLKACNAPPDACHQSAGTCSQGACAYAPAPEGTACVDDGNPCTTDVCDVSGTCLHPTLAVGTDCGAGSVCDASAQCIPSCWIDGALYAAGAPNPAGACQVCDPARSTSAWSFQSPATQCRGAADACDAVEYCTGSSAQCPADGDVAAGTSCGAGSICDASGQCSTNCFINGTLYASGATNPAGACQVCNPTLSTTSWSFKPASTVCRAATGVCDTAEYCTGISAQCPGDGVVANGTTCGSTTSGGWSSCGYSDSCADEGSQERSTTVRVCSSGTCQAFTDTETAGCYRNTEGKSCGTTTTGDWSSCGGFSDVCDQSGGRTRNVTTWTCSSGSCEGFTTTDQGSCSRSTTGNICGIVIGPWSACGGFSGTCGRTGTQSLVESTLLCTFGTCGASSDRTITMSCERDTTGASCDDGNSCTTGDTCNSGGNCSGGPLCAAGETCSNGVCSTPCSGYGHAVCNGVCTNLANNNNHCGACGNRCSISAGFICQDMECVCVYGSSVKEGEPGALPRCLAANPR